MTLNDVYYKPEIRKIFQFMGGDGMPTPTPWGKYGIDINLNNLDIYFFTQYGQRETSPFVDRYIPSDGVSIFDHTAANLVAALVYRMLYDKWNRMCQIAAAQYDPLSNYDMSETETEAVTDGGEDVHTVASTDTDIIDYGRTDTSSSDLTHGESISTSGSSDIYGFDSVSGAHANSDIGSEAHSGTDRTQYQGTAGGKDERTLTRSDNESTQYGKTQNKTRTLTRAGNIGVTTSTQMLEQGVAFWQWTLCEQMIKDVGEMLTSPIYM